MTAKQNDDGKGEEPADSATEEPKAEEVKNEGSASEDAITVVEPAPVSVGSPSGLLEEAVVQIQKLAELREQEVRRQERLITQMQDVVARHTRTNRTLLWIAGFTLLLVAVLAIGTIKMGAGQMDSAEEISAATQEIKHTVSAIHQASDKIDNLQIGLTTKLDNTVDAMRRERDEVKDEVRTVLDDHNANLVSRELALKGEEERLVKETERVKKERLVIIGDAINRLEAVAGELSSGGSAPQMEIIAPEQETAPAPAPELELEPKAAEPEVVEPEASASTDDAAPTDAPTAGEPTAADSADTTTDEETPATATTAETAVTE